MGKYIMHDAIKTSVRQLKNANVKGSTFFSYLILRRHMVLSADDPNALRIKGSLLKEAAFEAALVDKDSKDAAGFSPLEGEYRTWKWLTSNGPSDTIKNWSSRSSVVTRDPEAEGLTISVAPFNKEDVQNLLRVQDAGRPDMVDMAVWWYRNRDVESLLDPTGSLTSESLKKRFAQDLNLSDNEVSDLFADPSAYADADVIGVADTIADAAEYLPDPKPKNRPQDTAYTLKDYGAGSCMQLIDAVRRSGYIFTDEQIATYLTAVRTKPFVILAGISGTGKTHLPITLAQSTGSDYMVCPVRPDWTDSSPLLGYTDIQGIFHPGILLEYARKAMNEPDREYFFLLDEMNLARVEYYLSDVLSKMETMQVNPRTERLQSEPLMPGAEGYEDVVIPSNLCFVGSINMDESTQPISKKVLDRAFVLDFNEVDLSVAMKPNKDSEVQALRWSSDEWGSDRKPLFGTAGLEADEFDRVTGKLTEINKIMKLGGFNFGYRLRNEICAFIANAKNIDAVFSDDNASSSAFDIALKTKALSRIEGQGIAVLDVIRGLRDCLTKNVEGETVADSKTQYQRTLNKLSDMSAMFDRTGYASYWN